MEQEVSRSAFYIKTSEKDKNRVIRYIHNKIRVIFALN